MSYQKCSIPILLFLAIVGLSCGDEKTVNPPDPFSGITTTNEVGDVIGGDSTDWCYVTSSSSSKAANDPPAFFAFPPAYPNPCNGITTIVFHSPILQMVALRVYSAPGKEVRLIADALFPPGVHNVAWDLKDNQGDDLPDGIYRVVMSSGDYECFGDVQIFHP